MQKAALEGVNVLDLSTHMAGPYCTRLLAGLGARVIKIEPPEGDPARGFGPFLADSPGSERGALFQYLNTGKQSIVLDLRSECDLSKLRSLAARSQIVIESFSPGTLARLGLDYTTLSQENPTLVMTSISSFGQSGPYKDFRASELILLALGGMLYTTGEPDREPLMVPGFQASYQAGVNGAAATLAALYRAEQTGLGSYLDISTMESVVSGLEAATVAYDYDGAIRRRQGNRHGNTYPMAVLPCKDGFVGLMIAVDSDWELFAAVTGLDELFDSRFTTAEGRMTYADEIDRIVGPWLMERTGRELFHWAQDLRLPFAAVLSPDELLSDPQHRRRRFFRTISHPVVDKVALIGPPFQMERSRWSAGRAPLLGKHRVEDIFESAGAPAEAPFARSKTSKAGLPKGILDGIRVVDLTTMWAGPYCTRILADWGAEVIKIESPKRLDGTRGNPGYFNWLNRNKMSLTLDLNTSRGQDLFRQLVERSDIVVENFSPRVMPNFGLDYAALRQIKPDLIMLSMPAYGSTGPYRNYVSYGPGIEAASGLAWLTGYADGSPMLTGSAYGDPVAGVHGAVAILAAIRHRRITGKGQRIELSQREALSQMFGEVFVLAGAGQQPPPRHGNRHPDICPHGVYRCAGEDSWVAIAAADDDEWRVLCQVMGQGSLTHDPRFQTMQARKANEDALNMLVESWTRPRDSREAMYTLQEAGVTAGAVLNGQELSRDVHLNAREFFINVGDNDSAADGDGRIHQYPGLFCKTSAISPAPYMPAPRLGQHNDIILRSFLGLTKTEIAQLETLGVINGSVALENNKITRGKS